MGAQVTEAIAISEAAAIAAMGVAIVVLALKLGMVAPDLVGYGKSQVAAQLNQQQAENERDQEKAAREEAESELADVKKRLELAEKALAAKGTADAADEKRKVESASGAAVLGDLNDELHARPAGSAGAAAGGDPSGQTAAVRAAVVAGSADGGKGPGR